MTTHYLAGDLGAESGRLILGTLQDGRLKLEELHRFPNIPVRSAGSLHWNIPALFDALKAGLKKAAQPRRSLAGLSTDSWGVDYLLFDAAGGLMEPTFHYRDPRSQRGVEMALARVPWPAIFAESGVQFMPLNTLFQLAAETPERLHRARLLLGVGDGFNYLLSGVAKAEESMASTTQLYNPVAKVWSRKLLDALGVPAHIFPPVVSSGTRVGSLSPELARETGLPELPVIASCSHDTGAAVAAVPAKGQGWAYLSSGTWSLLGVELTHPVINDQCRELNFTNEIGFGSSVRLLKNIVGLWLVQECRRHWDRNGQNYDYATLTRLAAEAPPFVSLINPADARFLAPDNMPDKIAAFCRATGQPAPADVGAYVRAALESLALLYRRTLRQLEQLLGERIDRLHVVGGGSQNALLNQLTADALQIPVLAGPAEATATGNVLVQAIALGHLASLEDARQVVRRSARLAIFEPRPRAAWDAASERFDRLFS